MERRPDSRGKVRDIYDAGENLLMVATDRISAFDFILPDEIPFKGEVLNRISAFWFDKFADIVPNHLVSIDPADFPEEFAEYRDYLAGRAMLVKKAQTIPIECIVRGYLTGSGKKTYDENGTVCGIQLPEGLTEASKLPEPLFTPSTKAEIGEHDQNISKEEIIRSGLVSKEDYEKLEKYALELFARGTEIAAKQGLILVDTKYEFGKKDGEILLMDEIHTPDSSRYFYADGYQERFDKGEAQRQLSKEFVREWLMEHGFQGRPGEQVPEMTDEFVTSVSDRYIELYEHITGEKFVKDDTDDILDRIENNTKNMLARLK